MLTDEIRDECESVGVGVFGGRARLTKAIGNCISDYCWQEVLEKVCASLLFRHEKK